MADSFTEFDNNELKKSSEIANMKKGQIPIIFSYDPAGLKAKGANGVLSRRSE